MKVWMVIEDDDGSRHGFEIERAHVQYNQETRLFDDLYAPTHVRHISFTATWVITTRDPYRRYWPPRGPARPAGHDNDPRATPTAAISPPPRETNDIAGTSRPTD